MVYSNIVYDKACSTIDTNGSGGISCIAGINDLASFSTNTNYIVSDSKASLPTKEFVDNAIDGVKKDFEDIKKKVNSIESKNKENDGKVMIDMNEIMSFFDSSGNLSVPIQNVFFYFCKKLNSYSQSLYSLLKSDFEGELKEVWNKISSIEENIATLEMYLNSESFKDSLNITFMDCLRGSDLNDRLEDIRQILNPNNYNVGYPFDAFGSQDNTSSSYGYNDCSDSDNFAYSFGDNIIVELVWYLNSLNRKINRVSNELSDILKVNPLIRDDSKFSGLFDSLISSSGSVSESKDIDNDSMVSLDDYLSENTSEG